jgi:hypothetical protein
MAFDALDFCLFRVNYIDLAFELAVEEVFEKFTTWFLNIVRSTNYNDALRIEEFF